VNSIVVGAYKANNDSQLANQRVFSANIPMSHYENLQNRKRERLQYESINLQLIKQLSQIKPLSRKENQENEISIEEIVSLDKSSKNVGRSQSPKYEFHTSSPANKSYTTNQTNNEETMVAFNRLHDYSPLQNAVDVAANEPHNPYFSLSDGDLQTSGIISEYFEKPFSSVQMRKNVSFSKEIDVRTFQNNVTSILPKLNDSSNKPAFILDHFNDPKSHHIEQPRSILVTKNFDACSVESCSSDILMRDLSRESLKIPNEFNQRLLQESFSLMSSNEHLDGSRKIASSDRKLPGETPVKNLERTLKMAIIKEMSVEKIDGGFCFANYLESFKLLPKINYLGNDWRMFAKRIGVNDADLKEWVLLKLQFPMARVLSVWSCNAEATVRLLHCHLQAPCFKYNSLSKRIESFYDV
jgi:hypothetical protein